MRDDRERLHDILEAINRIQARTGEDREAFTENDLLQVWVIYHLQIVGEAALHVSESLRGSHPEIPWQQIIGTRHILVHGYFQTDLEILWQVVVSDLPLLEPQVAELLKQLDTAPGETDLPAGLAQPARRALIGAGYTRVEQLNGVSEAQLRRLHGMGPKAIGQLRQALEARRMALAGEPGGA